MYYSHRQFRLGKLGHGVPERRGGAKKKGSPKEQGILRRRRRGHRKKKMKILAGGNTLEVGQDLRDQRAAWRQMLGDVQGP